MADGMRGIVPDEPFLSEVSGPHLMDVMRSIARWVRLSGTEDEMRSVEYVRGLLDGYGFSTKVLLHDAYISLPGLASIEILGPAARQLEAITHAMALPTPSQGIEAEIVALGSGTAEDFGGGRARGRIALVDGLAHPGKVHMAEAAGALAVVFINDRYTHEMIVSDVWGSPTRDNVSRLPQISVLSVTAEVGAVLQDTLGAGALTVRVKAAVDSRWRKTPILVADLKGLDEDFVLFSGHIDSWHYGAMDNGTANATMVEVGRILAKRAPLRRGMRLCFWSGHSHGRYSGSTWYVDHHWEELHDHCVAYVNIDSVGGRGATVVTEGIAAEELRPVARDAIRRVTGDEFEGSRVGRSGDQSFVGVGVPSLFMSVSEQPLSDDPVSRGFALLMGSGAKTGGLGWWWHTTADTPDKIDEDLFVRDCTIYLAVLHRLMDAPVLPLDYGATAAAIADELQRLQTAADGRFDLSLPLSRARTLQEKASQLFEATTGVALRDEDTSAMNVAIKALARILTPVWYTKAGPFAHDPAHVMPKLPLLADVVALGQTQSGSDEAYMLDIELTRARNVVASALRQATEVTDRALARLS